MKLSVEIFLLNLFHFPASLLHMSGCICFSIVMKEPGKPTVKAAVDLMRLTVEKKKKPRRI